MKDELSIFQGLCTALARTRKDTQNVYYKVLSAQKAYFRIKGNNYTENQQENAIFALDGAMHKFYFGAFVLEQLWGVSQYLKYSEVGLPRTYDVKITTDQDEITFLLSSLLDQSLYYWRTFLDFYLKYLVIFITKEDLNNISTKEFNKSFSQHIRNHTTDKKAKQVKAYIEKNVFCKTFGGEVECWGDLLRSLRDKTTHQKLILPSLTEKKNKQGYVISWPLIRKKEFPVLIQEFEECAFIMLKDMIPMLYELNWVPGRYWPGMFDI